MGAVLDITEQRRLEERYAREARTDALTGLANRRGFEASADGFLRANGADGRGFGLIVLDLDRFKRINDIHGHATGDLVLRELAARLRRWCAGRRGGAARRDEFAIWWPTWRAAPAQPPAQRLVLAAQQPMVTSIGELAIGVSIGVARSVADDGRHLRPRGPGRPRPLRRQAAAPRRLEIAA